MNRREFLAYGVGAAGLLGLGSLYKPAVAASDPVAPDVGKLSHTDPEWKQLLTPEQYDVLRQEGTERPFTSGLLNEHRAGTFACVACDLPLFLSQTKFDSGTGWPSFYDHVPGHLETKDDYAMLVKRTEYHCARCGGHQGHVFNDGPAPTGLRYCNDGVALKFVRQSA